MPKDVAYLFDPNIGKYYYGENLLWFQLFYCKFQFNNQKSSTNRSSPSNETAQTYVDKLASDELWHVQKNENVHTSGSHSQRHVSLSFTWLHWLFTESHATQCRWIFKIFPAIQRHGRLVCCSFVKRPLFTSISYI